MVLLALPVERGLDRSGSFPDRGATKVRNFWSYSAGLAIAWAVVLILTRLIRGSEGAQIAQLVFGGFCIGWVSTTIARYVYPPPKRWEVNRRQE